MKVSYTGTGNWCRIITHKYLKNRPLDVWIRGRSFRIVGTSYFWNGFIRIIEWITCQLGWKVGNSLKIRVGIDPIAGLNSQYILSEGLRDYLTDLGITHLAHAQNLDGCGIGGTIWYSASDLLLGGVWADQWSSYVTGLSHGGIRIGHSEDKLLWMYDEQRGMVTTRKAYDLIVTNHKTVLENDIMMKIWSFNLPLRSNVLYGSRAIKI